LKLAVSKHDEEYLMPHKVIPLVPSTLEDIDGSFFNWIEEKLDIYASTNKGWEKVPIIWVSAERSFQIKNKKEIRDKSGTLILPLITVERSSMVKDPSRKGSYWANVPPVDDYKGGSITITKRINQNKTLNFANADSYRKKKQINFPRKNDKVVYQTISIPMPVYVDITYLLTLRTEYQQQMNDITSPFITRTGGINHFILERNGHQYEGFIQADFSPTNNVSNMTQEERKYETKITVKVLGYLIGEDKNQETPKIVIRENAVEVKIPREKVIFGDIQEHLDKQEEYPERIQNITDK
jgi:hypothetical protein